MLQPFLGEAFQQAYRTVIEQLNQQSAQTVLDMGRKLQSEVAERLVKIVHRHTVSGKFMDEEAGLNRVYPPTYRVRPLEALVTELRKLFPALGKLPGEAGPQAAAGGRSRMVRHSALATARSHE
jgi:hypothetical protein